MHELSLVAESRDYFLVVVRGLLIGVASLVAEHWLWDVWASVAGALGFSCPKAYGIFLAQGSNLCPLHWQVNS